MLTQRPQTARLGPVDINTKFVDPFIAAASSVLGGILGNEPEHSEVRPLAQQILMEQCNVSMGVTGAIQGTVIYGFSLSTADRIASKMLGTTIRTFDALAASAIAEMCNMINTNSLKILAEARVSCQLSPAVMIRPTGGQMSMLTVPAYGATVRTIVGEIHIIASIEEQIKFAQPS